MPGVAESPYAGIFPRISKVALKYTNGETSGILVRAALKKTSQIGECDGLQQYLRENRNRARRAGITDLGAFAASLGFDAIYEDCLYDDSEERIFTVVNRGALLIQKTGVFVKS